MMSELIEHVGQELFKDPKNSFPHVRAGRFSLDPEGVEQGIKTPLGGRWKDPARSLQRGWMRLVVSVLVMRLGSDSRRFQRRLAPSTRSISPVERAPSGVAHDGVLCRGPAR